MCSSFSSPTKLAQKIKNSIFTFLFLHFLNNQTHKITQIYKIKRHAHKNLQNTETFTNYLGCMDAAKWPPHLHSTWQCARDTVANASVKCPFFFCFPTHANSSEIGPSHADLGRIGSYQPKPPIHSEIPKKKKKKGAKCTILAEITKP